MGLGTAGPSRGRLHLDAGNYVLDHLNRDRNSLATLEPACKVSVLSKESWPYKAGWPYIQVITQYSWFWLGRAKNWPYIRVWKDLTSANLSGGLHCIWLITLHENSKYYLGFAHCRYWSSNSAAQCHRACCQPCSSAWDMSTSSRCGGRATWRTGNRLKSGTVILSQLLLKLNSDLYKILIWHFSIFIL